MSRIRYSTKSYDVCHVLEYNQDPYWYLKFVSDGGIVYSLKEVRLKETKLNNLERDYS